MGVDEEDGLKLPGPGRRNKARKKKPVLEASQAGGKGNSRCCKKIGKRSLVR